MSDKLIPLYDRVLVRRQQPETVSAGGIVLPEGSGERPDQGDVVAVGPGKRNDRGDLVALTVKPGDRVLFGQFAGQAVKVAGDELLVMREEDVLAIVAVEGAAP